ncbi:MAG: hypothetical protein ACM3SY_03135 [Candidatus Omnitrophota bacterium]
MKWFASIFIGFFIFLFLFSGSLFPSSDYKVVKDFSLSKNTAFVDSVLSFNGTVNIRGNLKGTVILFGGRLVLDGPVDEDVICAGAGVDIRESAVIKGDLIVIGGTLNRHPLSTVSGKVFNSKMDLKKIQATFLPLVLDSQTIGFIRAVGGVLWLILALILFALIPTRVIRAGEILEKNFRKVIVTGFVSFMAVLCLLVMFVVLSFFFIGIPLLFLLVFSFCSIYIFGKTVVFYFIGVQLSNRLKVKRMIPALFVVLGALVYILFRFIPYLGPAVLITLNLFELGIGVSFIFRRKLRLETQDV